MRIVAYVVRRILQGALVMLVLSIVVFVTIRLTGNPVAGLLQGLSPTKQAIAHLEHALGLDRPLYVQYAAYMWQAVRGNLGQSYSMQVPVTTLIWSRFPATLELALAAIVESILIAVPLGTYAALHRGSTGDLAVRGASLIGISFPNFWLGIMLVLVFSVTWRIFPASGDAGLLSLVLPATTLGLILAGVEMRLVRASVLEVVPQDYVRTARAKGSPPARVLTTHILRNALLSIVTFTGLQFAGLLGGVVIIEDIFAWPGLGQIGLTAVEQRDYPLVQGIVLFFAALLVLVNLLTDLSYLLIDPRIRFE